MGWRVEAARKGVLSDGRWRRVSCSRLVEKLRKNSGGRVLTRGFNLLRFGHLPMRWERCSRYAAGLAVCECCSQD